MARAQWPLRLNRPIVEVILTLAMGGQKTTRTLLADTGAGNAQAPFEILLEENDCLLCDATPVRTISVTGAFTGTYPVYVIRVQIPSIGFDDDVAAVGVPTPPSTFDGIAAFRFLNRFTYGNFGNAGEFSLEV